MHSRVQGNKRHRLHIGGIAQQGKCLLSSLQTYIHRERREPTLRTWLSSDLWTVFMLSKKDTVYYQSQRIERGKLQSGWNSMRVRVSPSRGIPKNLER